MARRKASPSISLAQVVAVVGLLLAVYFVIGFAKVALAGYRLRATKAGLEAEVQALRTEVAELADRKEYVKTDEYVEEAARREFKMALPGDQAVIPLFEGGPIEPARPPTPPPPAEIEPPWRAWWSLFFGD